MTDIDMGGVDLTGTLAKPATFTVEDAFWGYTIKSETPVPFGVVLGQAISFFFGVCFMIACLGIVLLPAVLFDGVLSPMRVGSATLFGAMAVYLLWFASRGTQAEVQVDLTAQQIRAVVHNRVGQPTVVADYAFDEIGGVFVEAQDGSEAAQLVLQYRSTSHFVSVAEGTEAQLIALRDRLGRDLLGLPQAA